jgi:predicted transcriptional regulator
MNGKDLSTDHARAMHIGVSRTTVARIQSGEIEPGGKFVAAVLWAHPDLKFEDLFEVVEMSNAERVA